MPTSNRKYWVWKHTWQGASDEDKQDLIRDCIKTNYAKMQYEYGFQHSSHVTMNWEEACKIKAGDIIFLADDNNIYAYGFAISPRLKADVILDYETIKKTSPTVERHKINGQSYRSDSFHGVIHFCTNNTVFYENLSEEQCKWGQRVDVDSWKCYYKDGIEYRVDSNKKYNVILEVEETYALNLTGKLIEHMRKETFLLISNKNIVLHGAPGTGKTYLTEKIASETIFGKDPDCLNDSEREAFKIQYTMVQFHPSYDYTDFVEGLRPIKKDGSNEIGFVRKDGVFKAFCKKALRAYNAVEQKENAQKFVFVIDEINRGDMSKIFGELFFSIDPCYRGDEQRKVLTQYQNLIEKDDEFYEGFYVPKNVYIIGTMNDIDRSVESMDFAMRRRFTFCEITAEQSAANIRIPYYEKSSMRRMNEAIEKTDGLGKDYQIGGAYLKDIKDKLDDKATRQTTWNLKIGPLVKEYLRGIDNSGEKYKTIAEAFGVDVEK